MYSVHAQLGFLFSFIKYKIIILFLAKFIKISFSILINFIQYNFWAIILSLSIKTDKQDFQYMNIFCEDWSWE